ncbi:MAG TPA: CocE/NonD family hydrolase C-terminal non-catalytic domain-containing protein, partial [Solirubrobacteraceae bacterium]|nr:CocE/NonD family hydrolase C-terminal non-catalytic domain-containing protein [Solirubrobacteraceae bacterium]
RFVRYDATDWPVPGTSWAPLALTPGHGLRVGRTRAAAVQSYPALPSSTFSTDPPNTAIIGGDGPNQLAAVFPPFTETGLSEPAGLTYTSAPLKQAVSAAGPLDLDVRLSTTAPDTAIWAVVADVWPDGSSHPLMAGRLLSDYPRIDRAKSLFDPATGALVQPYGIYSSATPAAPGTRRLYHVELWPIGNRFEAGHRIRLEIVGASAASKPSAPAVDSILVGGRRGARLMFPVLPGSDLGAALGG